jgi:hypothetical protein
MLIMVTNCQTTADDYCGQIKIENNSESERQQQS